MPFYKWISASPAYDEIPKKTETAFLSEDAFNRDLVRCLRGLSVLLSLADDIFTSVESDCRQVQTRTENLKAKIQSCQNVINNLNAKSVVVPVSNLTHSCQAAADGSFKSNRLLEIGLFSAHKRPAWVQRLHGTAHGPSLPVCAYPEQQLSTDSSFSSTDGRSHSALSFSKQSSLIDQFGYDVDNCYNDLRSASSSDSQSSLSCKDSLDAESQKISTSRNIQSTLVPIDVSGQTFHRMATLRRSLIHMDFLMRKKKKKDKRRNTVADVESSVLNIAVEPVVNGKRSSVTESETSSDSSQIRNSRSEVTIAEINQQPVIVCSSSEENNNSKIYVDTSKKCAQRNDSKLAEEILGLNSSFRKTSKDVFIKSRARQEQNSTDGATEQSKQPAEWAKRIKESVETKKKSRTHIPISTVSAAMTVAVKMRQTSGVSNSEDAQSSSGNWSGSSSSGRASSDSDDIKACLKDKVSLSKDSLLSESPSLSFDIKKHQESDKNGNSDQSEYLASIISTENSFSSRTKTSPLKEEKNHSFDSDDDLSTTSYVGYSRYTSSTSISTGSNESLNSLLSRTATEMSGSTETLISESKLPLPPPPPPPPPPRISSAKASRVLKADKTMDLYCRTYPSCNKSRKSENLESSIKSNTLVRPSVKAADTKKAPGEDSKSTKVTFSNLLQKKFKSKESHNKTKQHGPKESYNKTKQHSPTKSQKTSPSPRGIDMYGGQSNSGQKVTILLNGNKVPSPEKPKVQMRSFLPKKHVVVNDVYGMNGYLDLNENPSTYSSSCTSLRTDCVSPTNSEVFSDSAIESSDEMSIPLKYAPQITVMPQRRQSDSYQSLRSPCHCRNYDSNFLCARCQQNTINSNQQKRYSHQQEVNFYPPNLQSNTASYTTQVPGIYSVPKNAYTAHVVLDSNGHVVHSTSSLDRRLYNKKPPQTCTEITPSSNIGIQRVGYNYPEQRACNRNPPFVQNHQQTIPQKPYLDLQYQSPINHQSNFQIPFNKENRGMKAQHHYPTENYVSSQHRHKRELQNSVQVQSAPSQVKTNNVKFQTNDIYAPRHINFSESPTNTTTQWCSTNDAAYSLTGKSLLTQENVNQHAREMDLSSRISAAQCGVKRSPLSDGYYDNKSPPDVVKSNSEHFQTDKTTKSMTAEDLFAIIHDSKKRLNIKTESDISPTPSSSRSSSPSFFRQVSTSRNGLAETGFLSPRGSCTITSRDRRSWADFRSAGERKSLASDRMGPSKPTSLHEFKMLLLQTRSSTHSNQRKSAVEQLKATSPNRSMELTESMLPNSPVSSPLSSIQSSLNYGVYDGHLTVPLKRNHRSRGLAQPRYFVYPPILEDCSEEAENAPEIVHTTTTKCQTPKPGVSRDENRAVGKHVTFKTGDDEPQSRPRVHFDNSSMWV